MEIITSVAGKLAEYAVEAIWQQFVYLIGYKESTKKLDDELKRLGDKREGVQSLVDHAERNAQVVVPAVVTWLKNVDQAEKNAREFLRNRIGARHVHALNLKLRYSLSKKASKMTQDIIQLLQEGNNYDFNTVAYPAPPNKDYVSTSITDSYEHYSRISLQFSKNPKFPVDFLQFTNLKLLQLFYTSRRENRKDNIPGNFFQGMKGLAVLALVKNDTPLSLPPSLGVLKNLRSLFLHGCSEIEGLSMIGGLEKLEILSLVGSQIRIFPREVGQLKHLKLLDLCGCGSIQRMERGFSLDEEDRYGVPFENTLVLHEQERCTLFYPLLQKTVKAFFENLMDLENDLCELDRNGFAHLKKFSLRSCEKLKYMVDWSRDETPEAVFPGLESLEIHDLENLKEICHGQPSKKSSPEASRSSSSTSLASFGKLRSLTLDGCPKLKNIFSMSIARGLTLLQTLDVSECNELEEIISKIGEDDEKPIKEIGLFPELTDLSLDDLPKLRRFNSISSRNKVVLADKKDMSTHEMDKFADQSQRYDQLDIGSSSVLLATPGFQNLRSLLVVRCTSLRNLFLPCIAKLLVNLETLEVKGCAMMESIVEKEEEMEEALKGIVLMFPKLNLLELENLPNFTTFSAEDSTLALPSLEILSIRMCPKVKTLDHMINTSSSSQLKSTDFTTKPSSAVPKTKTVSDGSGTSMDSHRGFSRWLSCFGSAKTTLPSGSDGPLIANSTDEMNIIQQRDVLNLNEMMMMSKLVNLTIEDMDNMLYIWTDKVDGGFIPSHLMNRMNNLERMELCGCESLETIFHIERRPKSVDVLPLLNCLKELVLRTIPKLEQIWKNIGEGDFKNLKRLFVYECHNLKYLFSSDVAELLVELEEVSVIGCDMMEEIVGKLATDDQKDQDQPIHEKIKSTEQHAGRVLGLTMFKKLKYLGITRCHKLRHVFSGSFGTRGLEQLQTLDIFNCMMMEHIVAAVANEENEKEVKATTTMMNNKIVFPQLATLSLCALPRMKRFCQGNNYVMELPSLKQLAVEASPIMRRNLSEEFSFDYQPMLRH
ncbi:hypothetical protein FEM48_Zijuj09G0069500 [Ziziphus jujuba var. spinosa]|uniref:Disease resistance protein At4g27190-like leucine-rich repeats domain-containing protein n=1 Tax=Ziziphus jujuba var. spinosa TaxID=714518 RepID=A0A978URI2_ZIZJJ|nr:hypothetical protein FEM48_Zijuj09G0069500 [Ziziphus jujuba var. spinosa]